MIRGFNYGNLRAGGRLFKGETSSVNGFKTFENEFSGVRAIARTLRTYNENYGICTIKGLIARYAPPVENDTDLYIANLSQWTGTPSDEALSPFRLFLPGIVKGIIRQENGSQCGIDDQTIQAACDNAYEPKLV